MSDKPNNPNTTPIKTSNVVQYRDGNTPTPTYKPATPKPTK